MRKSVLLNFPAALACLLVFAPNFAHAQSLSLPSPAEVKMEDENGVDVVSGEPRFRVNDVSIGPLSHTISSYANAKSYTTGFPPGYGGLDNYFLGVGEIIPENVPSGTTYWDYRNRITVGIGVQSEDFFVNPDGSLEATKGGILDHSTDDIVNTHCRNWKGIWTYTSNTGAIATIDMKKWDGGNGLGSPGVCGAVTQITAADGRITRFSYDVPNPASDGSGFARLKSINTNDGFQLKYNWTGFTLNGVIGLNNAYETCDQLADTCTPTGVWRQSSYAWTGSTTFSVTDQGGQVTRFTLDRHHRVISVKPANATTDQIAYHYCARAQGYWDPWGGNQWVTPDASDTPACVVMSSTTSDGAPPDIQLTYTHDRILQVNNGGKAWTYNFPANPVGMYYYEYQSSAQDNRGFTGITTILGTGALLVVGSNWGTATFENSSRNRMISGQVRGEPAKTLTYDARGNITSDGIITAGFDATCSNIRTCNKPNWVRDVAGNQTDYTYDPVHGGVLTVTSPAVQVNGSGSPIRPQIRYAYVQRYAWFKNAAGVMTRSTEPIWLLASESSCRTSAAIGAGCGVAGDEVVTSYDYGPDSGPNNLLLRGKAITADGITLRTCFQYDQYGNKISETAPRANLAACP